MPDGVQLRRLATPVKRTSFIATRSSSRADAGLRGLRRVLTEAAADLARSATGVHAPGSHLEL